MDMPKILVVDDEEDLCEILKFNLEIEGYEVDTAFSAEEALKMDIASYQLLLLDVMMGEISGFKMASILRKEEKTADIPIIFLTAKAQAEDRIQGLELGADDYVAKPFGMMELVSRVKAVLRRSEKASRDQKNILASGDIEIDTQKHEVTAAGEVVNLTLKEYELLKRLMENQNVVMTRDRLLEDIWGYDFDGETRTVDVHVRTLRQKLGSCGEQIETVRGVGYRMSKQEP